MQDKNSSASLEYSLIRSSRKSIGVIVYPNGSVVVRAPKLATKAQIEVVLSKRLDWIMKHKRKFENMGPAFSDREFADGEKHLFLGTEYRLRIRQSQKNRVVQNGQSIDIECTDDDFAEHLMKIWYIEKANEVMPGVIIPMVNQFSITYHKSPRKISLKSMKSRWGSCSSKGNISINTRLIKSSKECIEYVVAHELCHLIELNHSGSFYALLSEFMPDWKMRKEKLEFYMR